MDLAVIVIPPQFVPQAMKECAAKGVKAVVLITAGFREIGGDGARLEAEVVRIARDAGIRFCGPNGNGHFNTKAGLFSMGSRKIKPGPISLISQSGNFGGHIVSQGSERGHRLQQVCQQRQRSRSDHRGLSGIPGPGPGYRNHLRLCRGIEGRPSFSGTGPPDHP